MAVAETLVTVVGPTVAKSVLKLWLQGNEVAHTAGDTVIDVLDKLLPDLIARRRGDRQLHAVGERIAETLAPLFYQHEVTDAGQEAVIRKIAETLDRGNLSAKLVVENNFDPTGIADHLQASYAFATKFLSPVETKLYQKVLRETVAQIIDVSSALPGFTESSFAEVLRRETILIERTQQILNEVTRIREDSQLRNEGEETARFEEDYRRAVIRKYDNMELFGIDLTTATQRYPLSVAYVSLSVAQVNSSQDTPEHSVDFASRSLATNEDEPHTISVEEALRSTRRLLVRGQAGSGKTTLLRWLAVNAARDSFGEMLETWNGRVPFFVPLRRFSDQDLPLPETFTQVTAPSISGVMPPGWVHHLLSAGRALVLIDGVDEVPQSQRNAVRNWLADLVETYSETLFVVTSRPSAVQEGWLKDSVFTDAELQPMDLPDIYRFVEHWHSAIAERLQKSDERDIIKALADHMKTIIERSPSIRNLATSPLLCAVLCALHRDRHQQLPSDRIELYEACFYMLLDRRDRERRVLIESKDYPRLTYRQKRSILEDLAYFMMRNGKVMIDIEQFDRQIERKLIGMERVGDGVTASDVRRLLIDRSGIVREPVARMIDFSHKTFQEFLCAKAAVDLEDEGFLIEKATDDQWQEVIILAAGLGTIRNVNTLVSGLIQRSRISALN